MAKKCDHNHECAQCLREEIKKHKDAIRELEGKLPQPELEALKDLIERENRSPRFVPVPYPVIPPINRWHGGMCACGQCLGRNNLIGAVSTDALYLAQ